MFQKSLSIATLFAVCFIASISPTSAAVLGVVTHDYGIGQYDPSGNDALTADGVTVSDQSTSRFSDVFDFSAFAGSVTSLELQLVYNGAGPNCPFGVCSLGETWQARLQGSNSSGQNDDLFVNLANSLSPHTIVLTPGTDVGAVNVWSHSMATSALGMWFSENSAGSDVFSLKSATLTVYGDPASVPEPVTVAMLGLGLIGAGVARRRQRAS